jgi:pimeloyl-ACP methyl ester carboxylesterase
MKFLHPYPLAPGRPHLVYLPGMDGSGRLFYRQAPTLAPFFNLHCLALAPQAQADWPELADGLLTLADKTFGAEPLTLCGESFGGCWALKAAERLPRNLERLILINPASAFAQNPLLTLGSALTPWLPEFTQPFSTLVGLPFLANLSRIDPPDQRRLLTAMRALPPDAVTRRLDLLRNFRLERPLTQIPQPTLIIASQGDLLLPSVEEAYGLQGQLPRAKLEILPHSGHACLLERDLNLGAILQTHHFLPPVHD